GSACIGVFRFCALRGHAETRSLQSMDQTTPKDASRDASRDASKQETLAARAPPPHVSLYVLGLCFLLALLGRGLTESFTVFLKPISQDFGWDRAQVVSVYSMGWLTAGLTAPVVGRVFDRSGPRAVYILGVLLLAAAFLIAAHAQSL